MFKDDIILLKGKVRNLRKFNQVQMSKYPWLIPPPFAMLIFFYSGIDNHLLNILANLYANT